LGGAGVGRTVTTGDLGKAGALVVGPGTAAAAVFG